MCLCPSAKSEKGMIDIVLLKGSARAQLLAVKHFEFKLLV